MSYLTFIFMGFITMLSKFAPDRYMNHISTSMTVVTCIDAYSHHKTDDWRLTLKQYENNSRPFYSDLVGISISYGVLAHMALCRPRKMIKTVYY